MLAVLRKARLKDKELRILILGLDNAGKSSIVNRLLDKPLDQVEPTFGFVITTLTWKGYRINLWDVGGQTSLRTYWQNYFEKTDTLIWTVDSSDQSRLPLCRTELHSLLQQEKLLGATLLVLANKSDLPNALPIEKLRIALDLDSIKSHTCHILACSAYTGLNISQAIDFIIADAKHRFFLL